MEDKYNMFLDSADKRWTDFIDELNTYLMGIGCKCDIKEAKSGYTASYTLNKKALINFDKETDFYLISKNLNLQKNLYLDSFYFFKLRSLREKWSELVTLANENSDYLVSSDAFFDLLKFLIDNLEIGEDEINVFEDEKGFSISLGRDAQDMQCSDLSREGLVSSLIELCPKKINLFCKNDEGTAGFLSKIFEERVNVCYDKSVEKITDRPKTASVVTKL